MASFFRWKIANKVLPFIAKHCQNETFAKPNVLPTFVKVNRSKGEQPQLYLPWKRLNSLMVSDDLLNPAEIVKQLRNQGLPTAEGIIDIVLSQSPLCIVFTVDKHVFSKMVLGDICGNGIEKTSCFFQDIPQKNIIIECRVPAIGEAFQLSHLRCALHTNFIANINKMVGHNVTKVMHIKDQGLSSAVLLTGYQEFGSKELMKNPNDHLSEVYKAAIMRYNDTDFKNKAEQCFEKLKKGDKRILNEWYYLKELSLNQNKKFCEKIGLTFDETLFDSSCSSEIKELENSLLIQNLAEIQESGLVRINVPSEDKYEYAFRSTEIDSAITNFSRDIVSALQRKEKFLYDTMYYVAPSSEKCYFSALFALISKMGYQWSKDLQHISLKNISFYQGKGRKFTAESFVNKAKIRMLEKLHSDLQLKIDNNVKEMAETLSLSSLIIFDMKHRRNMEYTLNWKSILSFERNSGISLQLCHAGLKGMQTDSEYEFKMDIDISPLLEPVALDLVRHLARFDEIAYKAYLTLEPCIIVQYLFSLWYFTDRATNILKLDIKGDRLIILKARLMLLTATLKILQKGLNLLGISPYETNYSPTDFVTS